MLGSRVSPALEAELFLFHTTVASDVDKVPDTITDAEWKTYVGSILFNNGRVTIAQTAHMIKPNLQFTCQPGDTNLYGKLLAKNAYVPEALEVIDIVLEGIILE